MVCTEMISAEGLLRNRRASERLLKSCPEERPLAVQIFGSNPDSMAEAAKVIEGYGVEVLDINMGCPVRKVVKGGSGAALLKDSKRAAEILRSVRKAISIPLTVKIRSGWDEKSINFLEIARVGEECGVDGLTLHGRTRTQGYGTEADWEVIAQTKRHLRIPVIGSGDLTSPEAIQRFFAQTNADGAMIGRGAHGKSLDLPAGPSNPRGVPARRALPGGKGKNCSSPFPDDDGIPGGSSRGQGVSQASYLVHTGTEGEL